MATTVQLFNPFDLTNPNTPVSPLSLKSVLNWSPRIAAHVEPWFNVKSGSHLNIGYNSNDPAVIEQQVAFLKQRGVDFVIFDWYGKDDLYLDSVVKLWIPVLAKYGMNFAICFDAGMFSHKGTLDVTTYLHDQMTYVASNYANLPNYEKLPNGQNFCIEFGLSGQTINWATIATQHPHFGMFFQNTGGFSHSFAVGAFAWVGNNPSNVEGCIESYQTNFLSVASQKTPKLAVASICKGFDDHNRKPGGDVTQSCWGGPARFADEKRGQTFLNVIDLLNASTFKPPYVQIVTFNDHEEGTFVEWGIDSTLQCGVDVMGSVLTVFLNGNLSTVDHVEIYLDAAMIASVPPGPAISLDLNSLQPAPLLGVHSIFAAAVGKPFFRNKTSLSISKTSSVVWS